MPTRISALLASFSTMGMFVMFLKVVLKSLSAMMAAMFRVGECYEVLRSIVIRYPVYVVNVLIRCQTAIVRVLPHNTVLSYVALAVGSRIIWQIQHNITSAVDTPALPQMVARPPFTYGVMAVCVVWAIMGHIANAAIRSLFRNRGSASTCTNSSWGDTFSGLWAPIMPHFKPWGALPMMWSRSNFLTTAASTNRHVFTPVHFALV